MVYSLSLGGAGDRNKDYNIVLDYIIKRLVDSGVCQGDSISGVIISQKTHAFFG